MSSTTSPPSTASPTNARCSSSLSRTRCPSPRPLGASDAGVEVSEGAGLSVSVRKGEIENVERNRDKSLGVTVYLGQRRGNASTSDFSRAALEQTVQRRLRHRPLHRRRPGRRPARRARTWPGAEQATRDLHLFHPWDIDAGRRRRAARSAAASRR